MKQSLLILFSIYSLFTFGISDFEQGISFYKKRSEKHVGIVVNPKNISTALSFFLKSYSNKKTAETAEYIIRCYYFKGTFCEQEEDKKHEAFTKGKLFGEKAILDFPNNAGLLYWHTITYGKYGHGIGLFSGVKEDIADNLKLYCEKVIELDSITEFGGGLRILGLINYQIPYVPFVVSWPDKDNAENYLKRALKIAPNNISNNVFMIECLIALNKNDEALKYIQIVKNLPVRKDYKIEDMWGKAKAKEMKEELEK